MQRFRGEVDKLYADTTQRLIRGTAAADYSAYKALVGECRGIERTLQIAEEIFTQMGKEE